jgi:acyl-CoA synthetase (AMP-forming)/AMP-acid ligase II
MEPLRHPRDSACLSILPRCQPAAVLDAIEADRCTVIGGVPTMLHALAQQDIAGRDLSALRVAVSGGASLPEDIMRTFEGKYRIEVLEGNGMTETASSCTFNRPGDLGYMDQDGFYFIVDRAKDLVIRGGYNVYPREIEEVLYAHPAILEAAVIGKPDERLGEEVVTVVALRPGHDVSAEDITVYTRERVAAYKYPREIRFMPELPKGPSGKILKSALRDG